MSLDNPLRCNDIHFTGKEIEMQIDFLNRQMSHPQKIVKLALNPLSV